MILKYYFQCLLLVREVNYDSVYPAHRAGRGHISQRVCEIFESELLNFIVTPLLRNVSFVENQMKGITL